MSSVALVVNAGAADADSCLWTSGVCAVRLQRPKSTTNQKTFDGYATVATTAEQLQPAVDERVREAVLRGESLLISCVGAPASGKSTTLRGVDGVAVASLTGLFDSLSQAEGEERIVLVSGVVAAIALPTQGKTPLTGKQPTRERLLDALLPVSAEQPANGLTTHISSADGLPHAAGFEVDGLTQAVVRSRAEAEALLLRCGERCAAEERSGRTLRCHLLLFVTVHHRAADGAEREQQLCFCDLAGVSRGGGSTASGPGARPSSAAARGGKPAPGGAKAAAGGGGKAVGGEDPVLKAFHRVVGARADGASHVPHRDAGVTRLLQTYFGGGGGALQVVHVRRDRYEESEAALLLGRQLQQAAEARPRALSWWRPQEELKQALQRVHAGCASLGLGAEGLTSSMVALDDDSSEELLTLQEDLLRAERLRARLSLWPRLQQSSDAYHRSLGDKPGGARWPAAAVAAPASVRFEEPPTAAVAVVVAPPAAAEAAPHAAAQGRRATPPSAVGGGGGRGGGGGGGECAAPSGFVYPRYREVSHAPPPPQQPHEASRPAPPAAAPTAARAGPAAQLQLLKARGSMSKGRPPLPLGRHNETAL